jgi:hypothetical protein
MFPQDHNITLEKRDGRIFNIPAHVQFPKVYIMDGSMPIEENDVIHFTPSNNLTEHYIVVDRGLKNAIGSFPTHYQVKVKRK